jgi:hypothetical protein
MLDLSKIRKKRVKRTRRVFFEGLVDGNDGRVKGRGVDGHLISEHAADPPKLRQHPQAHGLQGSAHGRNFFLKKNKVTKLKLSISKFNIGLQIL